jgi:hypothetical protein
VLLFVLLWTACTAQGANLAERAEMNDSARACWGLGASVLGCHFRGFAGMLKGLEQHVYACA